MRVSKIIPISLSKLGILLILISLPWSTTITSIAQLLALVFVVYDYLFLEKNKIILHPIVKIFIFIFGLQVLLMVMNGSNLKSIINQLDLKYPLILIPLIFIFIPNLKKRDLDFYFKYFSYSLIFSLIYCYLRAIFLYDKKPYILINGFSFLTEQVDVGVQYYSFYLTIVIFYFLQKKIFSKKNGVLVLLILIMVLLHLKSRNVILTFFLLVILDRFLFYDLKKKSIIVIFFFSFFLVLSHYVERFHLLSLSNAVEERFIQYNAVLESVYVNLPFGVGWSSVNQELLKSYFKLGFDYGFDFQLNSHNQYLSEFISGGLITGFIYIHLIFNGIKNAFLKKYKLLLYMSLSLSFFSMTEALLNRQKGLVIFILTLTIINVYKNK
ncbi:hypothetical protein EI427_15455 [Flammeovirga pectinis]|uniref:O-antigen ligase domain-containing protein n=1 Tax=Flammeovirga pectinis TaxID=2494373 RepID=A0A3Q9FRI5_9BACT|nr:hypothetical protein [Flammeovirga pectinis]AZQ63567.1 hypothetical protein EI427_15455 [Flammeovirga pectinis]